MRFTRHFTARLFVVTACLLVSDQVYAQSADPASPHAQDRAALQQIKDDYTQAVQSGELDELESKLAEGFSAVMVTGHEADSFAELRDYWAYISDLIGEDGTYSLEVLPEPAKFSGDYALSQGTTREVVETGGARYEFETLWSAVFIKQDHEWRLLRLHASMDPINNTFVSSARRQAIRWSLVVGAVAGLLLGGVGGMFLKRRSSSQKE